MADSSKGSRISIEYARNIIHVKHQNTLYRIWRYNVDIWLMDPMLWPVTTIEREKTLTGGGKILWEVLINAEIWPIITMGRITMGSMGSVNEGNKVLWEVLIDAGIWPITTMGRITMGSMGSVYEGSKDLWEVLIDAGIWPITTMGRITMGSMGHVSTYMYGVCQCG